MIEARSLKKVFRTTEMETIAVNDVSIKIEPGEFVAIMGPSGCGKSTLLSLLGLLDRPSAGEIYVGGSRVPTTGERAYADIRRASIGFVFQSFNLIDGLTLRQNVEIALKYKGLAGSSKAERAQQALEQVGLGARANHYPSQVSGGQQQRAAIARALAANPPVVLADEPTGNLDTASGEAVMGLLGEMHRAGKTVVIVTHSEAHAASAQRVLRMKDGRLLA